MWFNLSYKYLVEKRLVFEAKNADIALALASIFNEENEVFSQNIYDIIEHKLYNSHSSLKVLWLFIIKFTQFYAPQINYFHNLRTLGQLKTVNFR